MVTKAVIYARVSTEGQDTANQLAILESWAELQQLEIVGLYEETASAWKAGQQVELKRLVNAAHKRHFQIVLVWALDRLSREGALRILQLINKLKHYGVKVLSYQEAWTAAPGEIADLLYSIAAWVAQMESKRRSERTKAALDRLKKQGRVLGRPKGSKDKKKRSKRK